MNNIDKELDFIPKIGLFCLYTNNNVVRIVI